MQPVVAGRRPRKRLAELRLDKIRQVGCRGGRDIPARPLLALFRCQAMLAVPDGICLDIRVRHHERSWLAARALGDLLHAAAGGDGSRVLLQDCRAVLVNGVIVTMFDEQPVGPLAAIAIVAHPHQDEAAMQPLAMKRELEVALLQGLFR